MNSETDEQAFFVGNVNTVNNTIFRIFNIIRQMFLKVSMIKNLKNISVNADHYNGDLQIVIFLVNIRCLQ